jgi:hypothetical protein
MTLVARLSLVFQAIAAEIKAIIARSIPAGGTAGQVLTKTSATDYAVQWSSIIAAVLSGYVSSTGTIAATDTILAAIGKLNGNIGLKSNLSLTVSTKTASYTLALVDNGSMISMNLSAANSLTIPANATIAFPIGSQLIIHQEGSGQTTIVAASGVTINAAGGKLKLNTQFSSATLIKKAINVWSVAGDLVA